VVLAATVAETVTVVAAATATRAADTVATVAMTGTTAISAANAKPATGECGRGLATAGPLCVGGAMQRLTASIVWGALLVGVAGACLALRHHGGEEVFRYEQSRAQANAPSAVLSAAHVAAVVALAPEPVPSAERTRPAKVRCVPGGGATLRNPWSCAILYRSGTRAHYRVVVQPDGHYRGTGSGIISGCCVEAPPLD
jgi:hypothetical protein